MQKKFPKKESNELTAQEAASLTEVTKGAILYAINRKRLAATRQYIYLGRYRWIIKKDDLNNYRKSLGDRKFSKLKEELIYDKSKGLYSIKELSKLLKCKWHHLYHLIITGKIKSSRSGKKKSLWVIHIDDVMKYKAEREMRGKTI